MSVIEVRQGERGVVRVFALSMDAAEARVLRDNEPTDGEAGPSPIETALGARGFNPDFVEAFALADIREIGLDRYLEDGYGIEPAQLDPDRAKLAALDGWVLLVFSATFGGKGARLHPAPELTLVGTYSEPGIDWTDRTRLTSVAAEGTAAPAKKSRSDAAMSGRIALFVLLAMFLFTAVVIWISA